MLQDRKLDKNVPIPLYYQLKGFLQDEIKAGNYPVDSLIPTEKELSEMFSISRTTVRQALAELVHDGWLYRIKSKGTFVARSKIQQDFIKKLESFNDQIRRSGLTPSTEVLELTESRYPEEAGEMGLRVGAPAVCLHRRRAADGEPILTVKTFLPLEECRFMLKEDLVNNSMYKTLSRSDQTRICRVSRVLEAVAATKADAEMLGVRRGSPIHFFRTVGYNKYDQPIEFSLARYRGDRNRFEIEQAVEPF